MIKTVKEYFDERAQFFAQHKYDYNMTTSPMDEYGRYFKTYSFSDGAYWYESMGPEWDQVTVEVKRTKVKIDVKLFKTEYWNSKGLTTNVCYEKF